MYEWQLPTLIALSAAAGLLAGGIALLAYYRSANRRLRESEARYRALFHGCKAVELLIDPEDGRIVDANQAAQDYYGYPRERLTAMRITEINTLSAAQVAAEMERARSEQRDHFFFRHRRADGLIRDVEVHSGPLRIAGRTLLYSIVHDITDRRRAEENYRRLFENSAVGLYQSTRDGRLLRANPAMARLLGYDSPEELLRQVRDLGRDVYAEPGTREAVLRELGAGQSLEDRVVEFRRKDGSRFWASLNIRAITAGDGETFHYEGSLTDVTARHQAENAMQRARDEAEAASQAKSDFLMMMSHELRTPMNAIIGMADLLAEEPLSENGTHFLAVQRRASQGLLELLDDILDLSKVETGRLAVEPAPFSVAEVAGSVVGILKPRAGEKGLQLETRLSRRLPERVMGDAHRLRQVLLNLVGNAVKFTEAGRVELRIEPEPLLGRLRFTVLDTGIGIPAEARDSVFQPFTQVDPYTSRQYGGTGLGLTIAERLVRLMGGELKLESPLEGGSLFWFVLPLPEVAPSPEVASPQPGVVGRPAEPNGRALRILLAEDSEDNALLIQAYLRGSPHTVEVAMDGGEAVERFKQEPYDLVLMDMQMPVLDGYQATREIREWERSQGRQRVPILALTAHAMRGDAERSLAAGCDRHLTKPIRKAVLLEAMEEAAETAEAEQARQD